MQDCSNNQSYFCLGTLRENNCDKGSLLCTLIKICPFLPMLVRLSQREQTAITSLHQFPIWILTPKTLIRMPLVRMKAVTLRQRSPRESTAWGTTEAETVLFMQRVMLMIMMMMMMISGGEMGVHFDLRPLTWQGSRSSLASLLSQC